MNARKIAALALLAPLVSCSAGGTSEAAVNACQELPSDIDLALQAIDLQGASHAVIENHVNRAIGDINETGHSELDEAIAEAKSGAATYSQTEVNEALGKVSSICENINGQDGGEIRTEAPDPKPAGALETAYSQCGSPIGIRIEDEGETLIARTTGNETGQQASFLDVHCVLTELEAPSRTIHRIETTRSLDGRVTDSWDEYSAEWTYHPDNGLDLLIFVSP